MACEKNKAQNGDAMQLVSFFMKKTGGKALTALLSLRARSWHGGVKEGMLTSYVKDENHLLETYATSDTFPKSGKEIGHFNQLTNMSPLHYVHALSMHKLRCP